MCNNSHIIVKLAPELFDAKLTIYITFHDMPGEGSTQVTDFKVCPQIGNWCSS
jgi:hypothetical protein